MKKLRNFIIVLILIIIITIIAILILLLNNEGGLGMEAEQEELILYSEDEVRKVTSNAELYTVSNCIQQYLDLLNNRNEYISDDELLEDLNNSIYNILSQKYIDENKIQVSNIEQYIDDITQKVIYVPIQIGGIQQNDNIATYIAYGFIEDINNNYKKDIYTIINLDSLNSTFSVEPVSNGNLDEIKIEKIEESEIAKNEDNEYTYQSINAEYLSSKYLDRYKKTILARPNIAYEYLEEEYRNKKFDNIEEFNKYIENNKNDILNARLQKYSIIRYEDYIEYICIDQNSNYYIFREDDMLNYTVLLDNYTVDIPQFTEQYNNADRQTKCALNIEKVREALNHSDYKYVYSKLADSFKTNYFPTQASFEQYAKNTFFKKNAMTYSNVEVQNSNYIFTVSIIDIENQSKEPIEKTIVVQLKEGTDFVFSFSV